MSYALNLTLSEFSAGLWAKREQNTPDLEALGRSLEAIEPFASPEICCCKPDEANQTLAAAVIRSQETPIQVFPVE